MNMVALVGNVASTPEIRQTSTGKTLCSFRLAVSRIGSAQADFFTVVAWERQAEICKEFLPIGRRIGVEGRLRYTSWKTEEGDPRNRVEIIANRVELMNKSQRQRNEAEVADELLADADADSDTPEFIDPTASPVSDPFAPSQASSTDFATV